MPALDALQLKLQLYNELDTQTWRQFAEFLTNQETAYKTDNVAFRKLEHESTLDDETTIASDRHLAIDSDEFSIIQPDTTPEQVTAKLRQTLTISETYYVAPAMQTLIAAAAESMPHDEVIVASDLPSPQGFMFVPGGVVATDLRGLPCTTDAVLWDTYGGKVAVTLYVDKYNTGNTFNTERIRQLNESAFNALPRLTPWSFGGFSLDSPLPRYTTVSRPVPPELVSRLTWRQNTESQEVNVYPRDADDAEVNEYIDGLELAQGPEAIMLWFMTVLKLMQQTMVSTEPMHVPRATQRRMQRMKLANNRATVIELRRRKGQDKGDTHFEYSHRFLRRGHWRRQHYKEDGEWRRKIIWISPQIIGDPSLPLIIRNHVNALVR
jgi:hypothetical protein